MRIDEASDVELIKIEREATNVDNVKEPSKNDGKPHSADEESSMDEESSEAENRWFTEIEYKDPTENDKKENRLIAKILSTIVMDNWNILTDDSNC